MVKNRVTTETRINKIHMGWGCRKERDNVLECESCLDQNPYQYQKERLIRSFFSTKGLSQEWSDHTSSMIQLFLCWRMSIKPQSEIYLSCCSPYNLSVRWQPSSGWTGYCLISHLKTSPSLSPDGTNCLTVQLLFVLIKEEVSQKQNCILSYISASKPRCGGALMCTLLPDQEKTKQNMAEVEGKAHTSWPVWIHNRKVQTSLNAEGKWWHLLRLDFPWCHFWFPDHSSMAYLILVSCSMQSCSLL